MFKPNHIIYYISKYGPICCGTFIAMDKATNTATVIDDETDDLFSEPEVITVPLDKCFATWEEADAYKDRRLEDKANAEAAEDAERIETVEDLVRYMLADIPQEYLAERKLFETKAKELLGIELN